MWPQSSLHFGARSVVAFRVINGQLGVVLSLSRYIGNARPLKDAYAQNRPDVSISSIRTALRYGACHRP